MCWSAEGPSAELTICRTCTHCRNEGYRYAVEDWVCMAHERPALVMTNVLTGETKCEDPQARYINGHVYMRCAVVNDGACPDWAEIEDPVVIPAGSVPFIAGTPTEPRGWFGRLFQMIADYLSFGSS